MDWPSSRSPCGQAPSISRACPDELHQLVWLDMQPHFSGSLYGRRGIADDNSVSIANALSSAQMWHTYHYSDRYEKAGVANVILPRSGGSPSSSVLSSSVGKILSTPIRTDGGSPNRDIRTSIL